MTQNFSHQGCCVRIVMATCNGCSYLPSQLTSFAEQTMPNWSLYCADDGSSDGTVECLEAFARLHPSRDIKIQDGPGRGPAANFLTLLAQAVEESPTSAIAFSDQDDVWLSEKLERAVRWLSQAGAGQDEPVAWACRTILTNSNLVQGALSPRFPRGPSFGNALVQNILAGNTIVLSPAAARAVAATVPAALAAGVPYHDWWTYQILMGIGGKVQIESTPLVLYRQHGANHFGHHDPVQGRLKRFGIVMSRVYSGWIDANLTALGEHQNMLTPRARSQLNEFMKRRARGGSSLALSLSKLGVHRQTAKGDYALRVMALAGRL